MSSAERRAVRSANWRKEHKVKKTHQDVDHRDDYDHDHGDDDYGDDDHGDDDHGDGNGGLFPYICTFLHIWKRKHMEFWVPIMVMVIMEIILMMIYDRMAVDKKEHGDRVMNYE